MKIKIQIKKLLTYISATLALLLLFLFSFKSPIFRLVLHQKVERIEQKYSIKITFNKASLEGINKIRIDSLTLLNSDSTTISISQIRLTIPFREIVKQNLFPKSIELGDIYVNIARDEVPFDETYRKEQENDSIQEINSEINLKIIPNQFSRLLKLVSYYSTTSISVKNITIDYSSSNDFFRANCNNFNLNKGNLSTDWLINENDSISKFNVKTLADRVKNQIKVTINPIVNEPFKVPLVEKELGLTIKFDTLSMLFGGASSSKDSIDIQLRSKVTKLSLKHKVLADTTVVIDSAQLFIPATITINNFKVDSTSMASINKLSVPFYVNLSTEKSFQLKIRSNVDSLNSKDLFESIPDYLIPNLEGIKVNGFAKYQLSLDLDFSNLDSLNFNSKFSPLDFKIDSFGSTDFTKLKDSIVHRVFINDSTYKDLLLQSGQSNFMTLENISPYLVNAVIVSEDGGFFNHKGFDPSGFSYALAQNIKERELARGGSTITMQLVKNIYLNHDKTIARKIEEAIIVWLIETQRILEKEEILQIYFNIIEWGPGIYGVSEASKFYFNKDPKQINLNEAIFLASIVPRPKQFNKSFDRMGNLKEYYQDYYRFVSETMLVRNMINESDIENLIPNVSITGPAKEFIEIDSSQLIDDVFRIEELVEDE